MRIKILLMSVSVIIMFSIYILHGDAQEKSSARYQEIIDSFFSQVKMGKYQEAIDYVYSDNPWLTAKSDEMQQLKSRFVGLPNLLGNYLDHELLVQEDAADRLVHLKYFVAFERSPISFTFEFYRSKDRWVFYSFSYADDVDDWLEERAKIEFYYKELTRK